MVEIKIGTNEKGQRFDRFLRKYLPEAPLSLVYKIVRKDAKVNLKRVKNEYILEDGDVIQLYLSEDDIRGFRKKQERRPAKRTFRIAYEDDDILIIDKPAGLLTHGDKTEKRDHLTNQVQGYLMEKGEFDPAKEKTFAPSPVNRLDRNTSGLVIFAKNYDALKKLNEAIRERACIRKFYLTIVLGKIDKEETLRGAIEKDENRNVSRMSSDNADEDSARTTVTHVKPLISGTIEGMGKQVFTLAEVEIETGRTHQIRVQLADIGHQLLGDPKYGDSRVNKAMREKFGLTHQLLTAKRLEFSGLENDFPDIDGKSIEAKLPAVFNRIRNDLERNGIKK